MEEFRVEGGVKQGNPLSPTLLILVIDRVLKERDVRCDISTRHRQRTAYADGLLIKARTRQSLIDTFQHLKNNSMEVGLIINEKKTKYLKNPKNYTRNESLNINNLQIEQVQQYKYLGSIINVSTQSKKESKRGQFSVQRHTMQNKNFSSQIDHQTVETKII